MPPPRTDRPERKEYLDEAERALLGRFRQGERQQPFELLTRPHLGAVLALARRLTSHPGLADELVQEALLSAFRGLDAFRGDASLRTWMLKIVARLATRPDRWKVDARGTRRPANGGIRSAGQPGGLSEDVSVPAEIPDDLSLGPEGVAESRELRDRLEEALERLPPRQRAALHLRAVEGCDYDTVATTLDCTLGAARMLVLEARRKVSERMGGYLKP